MKIKRIVAVLLIFALNLSLIAGCGKDGKEDETKGSGNGTSTEVSGENTSTTSKEDITSEKVTDENGTTEAGTTGTGGSGDDNTGVSDIKNKYKQEYVYTEPLYNLDRDYKFVFEIGEGYYDIDGEEFMIFYDSGLEKEVMCWSDKDYDKMLMTVYPMGAFDYTDTESNTAPEGNWGTRSKFYFVKYYDFKTGKKLETPEVTVFTMKDDLNPPTTKQYMGNEGYYELSWSAVEGADYYEVYYYYDAAEVAELEYTTTGLVANSKEFNSNKKYNYEETEDGRYIINSEIDEDCGYFVVAKSNDGKVSGMGNECKVKDVAKEIPYSVSEEFVDDYEIKDILELPAYVDVEMVDESIGKVLIDYENAEIEDLGDIIWLDVKMKNLPLWMPSIQVTGMDYDTFMKEYQKLVDRADELDVKAVNTKQDLDIPFVPGNILEGIQNNNSGEKETTTSQQEESTTEQETTSKQEESTTKEGETTEKETTEKETTTKQEKTTQKEEPTTGNTNTSEVELSKELLATVYANSALSEWIAINLLAHNETISLVDFPESSNTDYLSDAFYEAYLQNPLCGMVDRIGYNYIQDALVIQYGIDKDETIRMQNESLKAAEKIASSIIKEGMSDFEKVEAINKYLCDNAEYNEEILEYVNADGTVDDAAAEKYIHSFTPYGILVDNFGVCESYSEAFLLLAKEAGIEAIIETGKAGGVNHEWNRVKVDNDWCVMDVTSNDNEYVPNILFNVSDEACKELLMKSDDNLIDDYVDKHVAKTMEHEYYTMKKLYATNTDDAIKMLVDALGKSDIAVIRVAETITEKDAATIVQSVVETTNLLKGKYFFSSGMLSIIKE